MPEVKMVDREVIKPITLKKDNKLVEFAVGEIVSVSEANAEIFKDRLVKVGAAKSPAGRKAKIEKEHAELTEKVGVLEGRIADLEAQNIALHAENAQLKAKA